MVLQFKKTINFKSKSKHFNSNTHRPKENFVSFLKNM